MTFTRRRVSPKAASRTCTDRLPEVSSKCGSGQATPASTPGATSCHPRDRVGVRDDHRGDARRRHGATEPRTVPSFGRARGRQHPRAR
jgi:hypothetical protein